MHEPWVCVWRVPLQCSQVGNIQTHKFHGEIKKEMFYSEINTSFMSRHVQNSGCHNIHILVPLIYPHEMITTINASVCLVEFNIHF